jgi:uncharacterized protein (TIGR02391 family)
MPEVLNREADELIEVGIDELAILMILRHRAGDSIHENNELLDIQNECRRAGLDEDATKAIARRAATAYSYLRREGFIATEPGGSSGWEFVTEARNDVHATYLAESRNVALLRQARLDPRIATKVRAQFRRGLFPEAVFSAMRTVEEEVRRAAALDADRRVGTKLMGAAFGSGGALYDPALHIGEREAMAPLFIGAIGAYKNPSSHRSVNVDDPQEAAEIILLANNLLRIVDRAEHARAVRAAAAQGPGSAATDDEG